MRSKEVIVNDDVFLLRNVSQLKGSLPPMLRYNSRRCIGLAVQQSRISGLSIAG